MISCYLVMQPVLDESQGHGMHRRPTCYFQN